MDRAVNKFYMREMVKIIHLFTDHCGVFFVTGIKHNLNQSSADTTFVGTEQADQ